MQFNILGPLEVVRDGERLELESFKRKSMLALLLINAPDAVSSDRLIDELWGTDASMDRQNALWVQISKLRSALEPDRKKRTDGTVVLTREPGYVVDLENHRLDVQSFEPLREVRLERLSRRVVLFSVYRARDLQAPSELF